MTSPRSAQSAPARKGHTEARLFTRPLPENLDPDRTDGCACGCGLNPDTSWGFEVIAFLVGVCHWTLLPWQRWLYIHALEKDETGLGFRFETLVILIARQNGKTQWLKGLGLWKLYMDGAEKVLITAQNLPMAEETLAEAVADVKATKLLRREYAGFNKTNGKFRLTLKPRADDPKERPRTWLCAAANRRGGRSLSADLAMLDELREHQTWHAWDAIVPTTQARERSLVVCTSNAGDATSIVLRSLRNGALKKIEAGGETAAQATTGLFEWSIPEDADWRDPQFWPMANPSMGLLPGFSERRLRARMDDMSDNPNGFKTEYLCYWVSTLQPGKLPLDAWKASEDTRSRRAKDAPVWASVDTNFERTVSYISVAAKRTDGRWHTELVAAARGVDWVLPWFTDPKRRGTFAGVVVQARGAPASSLIETLRAAGTGDDGTVWLPVVELGGPDLTKAYSQFYDILVEDRLRYRPSPALNQAVEMGQAKNFGDEWVLDRKRNDSSAAIASVQAVWGAARTPDPVFVSAYESEGLTVV